MVQVDQVTCAASPRGRLTVDQIGSVEFHRDALLSRASATRSLGLLRRLVKSCGRCRPPAVFADGKLSLDGGCRSPRDYEDLPSTGAGTGIRKVIEQLRAWRSMAPTHYGRYHRHDRTVWSVDGLLAKSRREDLFADDQP